jgi:hypothetical protein
LQHAEAVVIGEAEHLEKRLLGQTSDDTTQRWAAQLRRHRHPSIRRRRTCCARPAEYWWLAGCFLRRVRGYRALASIEASCRSARASVLRRQDFGRCRATFSANEGQKVCWFVSAERIQR